MCDLIVTRPLCEILLFVPRYSYLLNVSTTFLHTNSWLNWVDEDEVGLTEKQRTRFQRCHYCDCRLGGGGGCRCVKPEGTQWGCEKSWPLFWPDNIANNSSTENYSEKFQKQKLEQKILLSVNLKMYQKT